MARRIGAIGRTADGVEARMYFDSLASLVQCSITTDDVSEDSEPKTIPLDELLAQHEKEIKQNTASHDAFNNLLFQLAAQGIIDGTGLETVVSISNPSDIVLISGVYTNRRVHI